MTTSDTDTATRGWLTEANAAKYLDLSIGYLRNLRAEGKGPKAHRLPGGRWGLLRYHVDDCDEWVRAHPESASSVA